jgi:hypothetical protein
MYVSLSVNLPNSNYRDIFRLEIQITTNLGSGSTYTTDINWE